MFVELLEIAEATMVITTLSVGLISTSVSIVKGTHPPDFGVFVSSVQPPYESDDKRIYPDILEEKELVPPEKRNK